MSRITEILGQARLTERARFARHLGLGAVVALGEGAAHWTRALAAKGEAVEPTVLGPVAAQAGRVREGVAKTAGIARGWMACGARRVARGLDLASSGDLATVADRLESLARALDGAARAD